MAAADGRELLEARLEERAEVRRQHEVLEARWTAELLTIPELRPVSSHGERRVIAMERHEEFREALSTPAHPNRWAAHGALRAVGRQLAIERNRVIADLDGRIDELAAGLAATETWQAATTKTTRMQLAKECLALRGEGFLLPVPGREAVRRGQRGPR